MAGYYGYAEEIKKIFRKEIHEKRVMCKRRKKKDGN